jgi:hypothetical protein
MTRLREGRHMASITPDRPAASAADGALAQLVVAPGTRLLSESQRALIVAYEHLREGLSGPTFTPPVPEITRITTAGGKVRIYGRHLRDTVVVNIGGAHITRGSFRFNEGAADADGPHIEAEPPPDEPSGPITIFSAGGSATSRQEFRPEAAAEAAMPARGPAAEAAEAAERTAGDS